MQSKAAADMRGPAGTGEAHTQLDRGATQGLDIYEHLRMAAGLLLFFGCSFFLVQGVQYDLLSSNALEHQICAEACKRLWPSGFHPS